MAETDPELAAGTKADVPWAEAPQLVPKPEGMQYGYVALEGTRPVLHECTQEQLEERVASGEAVEVVVPEFDGIAPPSIVEELWPAVLERERRRRERERQAAFVNVLIFGGISLYAIQSRDPWWQIVLIMFVLFGVVPLLQYLIGALRRRVSGEGNFEETRERTLFGYWLGAGEVTTTTWCVRVLVGVFALQVLSVSVGTGNLIGRILANAFVLPLDPLIHSGALVKPLGGEWWRLLTCGLLHGGLLHIGFNGMAFKAVGEILERFYGGAVMVLTFFLSVLGGSIASVLLMPGKPSVGASGGILGLVGFLLVVGVRHRESLPADFAKSIIRSVLFMAALGVLARDYIDNAAHAGGFLVGCLIALPLSREVSEIGRFREGKLVRSLSWVAIGSMGLATLWVVFQLLAAAGNF